MGDATATIKRKFKTTKERIKKSEVVQDLKLKIAKKNIQDKEVTYKGKDNKDITTKITTLIKTFEKEIKEYEKKWEKEAKSNKFYKTFAKYEPYYKKTKANFKECKRNIEKTETKIIKGMDYVKKQSSNIEPKNQEKIKEMETGLNELKKNHTNYNSSIPIILKNLQELRKKEKELISKANPNFVSPQFLKNKLKTIKKHVLDVSKNPSDKDKSNQLATKIQNFDSLLDYVNSNVNSSINDTEKFYNAGYKYLEKLNDKIKNDFPDDTSNIKDVDSKTADYKTKIQKEFESLIPKDNNDKSLEECFWTCFTLGLIHSSYVELSIISKNLYPKFQAYRKKVDVYTDSLLRKGVKVAAPLLAGAIGILAGVTGVLAAPAAITVSGIAWLAAQASYSGMEILDSFGEQMIEVKGSKNSPNVLDIVKDLTTK